MSTLSACIVVKNGKASILRCLDALLPMANEYVVIDTGSTDGTLELLASWVKKHPRQRVVHECVGSRFHDTDGIFDFGAAKNYAISKATCDYVMWVDVNDILLNGKHARKLFESITYRYPSAGITMLTKVTPTFSFPRMRIIRRTYAEFRGIIHEIVVNKDENAPTVRTQLVFENYKESRDIGRNLKALLKVWDKEQTQRTAFYLGNSYKDMNDYGHAFEWYCVTIDMFPDTHNEDRFKAMETICEMIYATKTDLEEMGYRALQMIEERPDMPEGYYYRARYNYEIGDMPFAMKCLEKILTLRKKPSGNLWINREIYDRRNIMNLLTLVREQQVRMEAEQWKYADPIQPEYIGTGYPAYDQGYGPGYNGFGY